MHSPFSVTFGKEGKPPLVILHGWGLSHERYAELGRILSKDFFVLIPDFPGFGNTPLPESAYSVADYVIGIKDFLRTRGISSFFLIGHSFGGRIALKLASENPSALKGLILTGAPGVERFSLKRSFKRALLWIAAKILKPFFWVPGVQEFRKRFYERRDLGKLEGIMKDTFLKVIEEDLTPDAQKITCRTLLLWGMRDRLVPIMDAEKLLEVIPGSYLKIFAQVGHGLPYEKPHEFAREIKAFLFRYL